MTHRLESPDAHAPDGQATKELILRPTAGGVILSGVGDAAAKRTRLTATAATFAAQPETLFVLPQGFQDLSLPPPETGLR